MADISSHQMMLEQQFSLLGRFDIQQNLQIENVLFLKCISKIGLKSLLISMQKIKDIQKNSKLTNYIANAPKLQAFKKAYLQIEASIRNSSMPILQHKLDSISKFSKIGQNNKNSKVKPTYLGQNSKRQNLNTTRNKQNIRQPVRKMRRCTTDKNQFSVQKWDNLTKYFQSISNTCKEISVPCLQDKEQNKQDKKEEHKKFMMDQLSFTAIDQERIQTQKKTFQKFSILKKNMLSKVSGSRISIGLPNDNHSITLACLKLIDKVYKFLNELESLGCAKKSNKYVIFYCTSNQTTLSDVFLYESKDKNRFFSLNAKYYIVSTADKAKCNFKNLILRNKGKSLKSTQDIFQKFVEYIQQLFIRKKHLQLQGVSQYLEQRLIQANKFNENKNGDRMEYLNLRIQKIQEDKINFADNLVRIQQRYGCLNQISKVSRKRYEVLNQTYQKLQELL